MPKWPISAHHLRVGYADIIDMPTRRQQRLAPSSSAALHSRREEVPLAVAKYFQLRRDGDFPRAQRSFVADYATRHACLCRRPIVIKPDGAYIIGAIFAYQ